MVDADLNALIGNCSPDEFSDGLKLKARFPFEVITTQGTFVELFVSIPINMFSFTSLFVMGYLLKYST